MSYREKGNVISATLLLLREALGKLREARVSMQTRREVMEQLGEDDELDWDWEGELENRKPR